MTGKKLKKHWRNGSKQNLSSIHCLPRMRWYRQGSVEDFIQDSGKWQEIGPFHLKFEKWNKFKHSIPKVMKGFGGWIKIRNLPLDYWCKKTFEAIGEHFGGLENIATETLNLLNCSEAKHTS